MADPTPEEQAALIADLQLQVVELNQTRLDIAAANEEITRLNAVVTDLTAQLNEAKASDAASKADNSRLRNAMAGYLQDATVTQEVIAEFKRGQLLTLKGYAEAELAKLG